eukprot:scaffold29424_cov54-Cyclotella_meneghiniana.AAC.10
MRPPKTLWRVSEKGRVASTESWARRTLAAATSFMADKGEAAGNKAAEKTEGLVLWIDGRMKQQRVGLDLSRWWNAKSQEGDRVQLTRTRWADRPLLVLVKFVRKSAL